MYDDTPDEALFTSTSWGAAWSPQTYPPVPVNVLLYGQTASTIYAGSDASTTIAKSIDVGSSLATIHVDYSGRSSQIDALAHDPHEPATL